MKLELVALSVSIILFWGMWAFFYKLGAAKIGLTQALLCAYMVGVIGSICILGILIFKSPVLTGDMKSYGFVALGTVFGIVGTILWYLCLSKYESSIIVPFTALYPLVTVILGIFVLKEHLQPVNVIGILLALIACFLLAV